MSTDSQAIKQHASAFEPLRRPVFRAIWLALIISGLGSWMHDIGAGWLMATLAPEPFMVALVQAATLTPLFLLTLPAGALADMFDRRRYLIGVQVWMMLSAGSLAAITLAGAATEWWLLLFTFALGSGTAMMMPAFSALIPDLVPRHELTAAITLNSIAFNAMRAIGPAVAGIIVAATGPGIVFAVNAASFVAVILVFLRIRIDARPPTLPLENFAGSMRSGLRYVRHSRALLSIILRGMALFLSMGAPLAFLPLVVKAELNAGASAYGLLLSCLGVGAVTTGLALPAIRRWLSTDAVVSIGTAGVVAASLCLAWVRELPVLAAAMLVLGGAWISAQSSLQVTAQLSLPAWVRGRGLSVFMAVFMGVMAAGAATWGKVAEITSISIALTIAAGLGALGTLLTWPLRLEQYNDGDHGPCEQHPLEIATPPPDESAPLRVRVGWHVRPENAAGFQEAMRVVRRVRLRNGARRWSLAARGEGEFEESFEAADWLDYRRQRERLSNYDAAAIGRALALCTGGAPAERASSLSAR